MPYDRNPAPGSRGLPLPRSIVEAMSMLAFARQQGVTAFWGRSPDVGDDVDSVTLHWPTEEGGHLKFRKRESRCVLISSGLGPRARMYAHLRPCDSKQASGLLTVAAAAAPPPPPGVTVAHYYDPLRVKTNQSNQPNQTQPNSQLQRPQPLCAYRHPHRHLRSSAPHLKSTCVARSGLAPWPFAKVAWKASSTNTFVSPSPRR